MSGLLGYAVAGALKGAGEGTADVGKRTAVERWESAMEVLRQQNRRELQDDSQAFSAQQDDMQRDLTREGWDRQDARAARGSGGSRNPYIQISDDGRFGLTPEGWQPIPGLPDGGLAEPVEVTRFDQEWAEENAPLQPGFDGLDPAQQRQVIDQMARERAQGRAPRATGLLAPGGGSAPAAPAGPQPGTVADGYRFRGGNPNDQGNWERIEEPAAPSAPEPAAEPSTPRASGLLPDMPDMPNLTAPEPQRPRGRAPGASGSPVSLPDVLGANPDAGGRRAREPRAPEPTATREPSSGARAFVEQMGGPAAFLDASGNVRPEMEMQLEAYARRARTSVEAMKALIMEMAANG